MTKIWENMSTYLIIFRFIVIFLVLVLRTKLVNINVVRCLNMYHQLPGRWKGFFAEDAKQTCGRISYKKIKKCLNEFRR